MKKFSAVCCSCVMALVVLTDFIVPSSTSAEAGKSSATTTTQAELNRIAGKWLRPDGGYVLKLSDVKPDGKLKAEYFNPRSINVAKAEWRRMGDRIQVFVELRDVNYPGSTYTLVYSPEKDRLEGNYYQAMQGETYTIWFMRTK
jgi:hypothetical protein